MGIVFDERICGFCVKGYRGRSKSRGGDIVNRTFGAKADRTKKT